MGDPKGFLKINRVEGGYRPVEERLLDYSEVEKQLPDAARKQQASRCMDCGVPFCHWACPVGNIPPEWQDKVFHGDWKTAYDFLQETINFPEFTGRVCPALCEASCVLSIEGSPVTIRHNELAIIEKAFADGYVKPRPPEVRNGKKVAVIGGGPAGLACADDLNKKGYSVVLFESEKNVGGYLRYGIPDFKLDKSVIDRRVEILKEEGLEVKTCVTIGKDITISEIEKEFDAVCLTIGAREPRDLPAKGRDGRGINFAMEYLAQQNKIVGKEEISEEELIQSYDKYVVVIGGGDTGSDCVGTANRKGARNVIQLELMPQPSDHRGDEEPWPLWPRLNKTSSSHEEGCDRKWNILTKEFICKDGDVKKILAAEVEWKKDENGRFNMTEIPGSEFELKADLVLLAMGFVHAVHPGLVNDIGIDLDDRGNLKVNENMMTSKDGVFAAGDSSRGASLVVWAIKDGKDAASGIDRYFSEK